MMWATDDKFYSSMKWHNVDESTIEHRFPEEWERAPKNKLASYAHICCLGKAHQEYDRKYPNHRSKSRVKLRKTINILQNNVCSYCRRAVLKAGGGEPSLYR